MQKHFKIKKNSSSLFAFTFLFFANSCSLVSNKLTWGKLPIEKNFYIKCDKEKCYAEAKICGKTKLIEPIIAEKSTIKWHSKTLGELHMSCGSPCSISIFVNFKNCQISRAFPLVVAIDPYENILLFVDDNNQLIVSDFSEKTVKIERNFSKAATVYNVIQEAKFENKRLMLDYLSGDNFEEKKEIIELSSLGF